MRGLDLALDLMAQRIASTACQVGEAWPHFADPQNGDWTTTDNADWTGGYWSGMLWIAGATGQKIVAPDLAARLVERLVTRTNDDTVSRGFLFYYGAALGQILAGDERAGAIAIAGARAVAGTYNPAARIIPVGAHSEEEHSMGPQHVTIDGLVGTLPLLAWAAARTGDQELREIARQDARRHVEFCLRPDGSVGQSAEFDPVSGRLIRTYTHKGLHANSTWARAQAWGILAFAAAARWFPGEAAFAEAASRAAAWWIAHAPADDIVPWDFDAPAGAPRDSSASAIAAAGMLKLAPHVSPQEAGRLRGTAGRIVAVLTARHLTPVTVQGAARRAQPAGMLLDGCYNPHVGLAPRHELIWGSYYLYEAANVLDGRLSETSV